MKKKPRGKRPALAKRRQTQAQRAKVAKVMGEFKRGQLRSGSKTGPKVVEPAQAKAIAMHEAGLSRKKRR